MEAIFAIGLGLQAIASLVVGTRLLLMARRTRRFPEFAFGTASVGILVVGFPMMLASGALDQAGVAHAWTLHAAGGFVVSFAMTMSAAFTWRVFRPKSRLALVFVAASALAYFVVPQLATAVVFEHGFSDVDAHLGWPRFAVPIFGISGQAWAAWESFRQYGAMRRRRRLGLVSAEVCNRFFLFGCLALSMLVAIGSLFFAMALGKGPIETPWFVGVMALVGAAQAALLFLAFMPPVAYRRLLAESAAAQAA